MPPIRVALIGLSSGAATSWAEDAHLPYLLSSRGQSHYRITALLNSSLSSAEAAKKHFDLPSTVKAYADPEKLAKDADVDLVVVCTRVDVHAKVVEPSIKAGKGVFIEWPLTESVERSLSLVSRMPPSQIQKSIIGLQARVSPVIVKIIDLLRRHRIGRVLSSSVSTSSHILPRAAIPEGVAYFLDRKVGGNPITIHYGHMIDFVHHVLGEFKEGKWNSLGQIQRPEVEILGGAWTDIVEGKSKVLEVRKTDVPDLVTTHGALNGEKEYVKEGATLDVRFRIGPSFKGQPAFTWIITGEDGEILVIAPSGPHLNSDSYGQPVTIQVHNFKTDRIENEEWDWQPYQKDLLTRGRSIAELYDRYAEWVEDGCGSVREGRQWPTLEDAMRRAKEIDELLLKFDAQNDK